LRPVAFADLPGWRDDDPSRAVPAFRAACARMPEVATLGGTGATARLGGAPAAWRAACAAAAQVPDGNAAAARAFFEANFTPFALSNAATGSATGLFTGYYEPEVAGSRIATPAYRTPLLSRPPDLMQVDLGDFAPDLKGRHITGRLRAGTLVPYYDRAEIEAGALARRRLEILWLADPVDAFVLQIQGSGRVRLPDGRVVRVTYAGQNGRPYVPIGRVLADRGEMRLDAVSMPAIRAWLAAHPDQAKAVMDQNPSYVFFREADDLRPDDGPPGALGANLTPGRSAAVDPAFIPLGAPLFVATTDPLNGATLRRLMVAEDTGGAIKGPVRADLFWGWGKDAETRAGLMRAQGTAWVLLPRGPES
jgi:membrane-bound lytic murein transglycosylase A